MQKIDIDQRTHSELVDAAAAVRAYEGSDLSRHAITLMDALSASYCLDLMSVSPEGLLKVQAALKQVMQLRNVFANEGLDLPKI